MPVNASLLTTDTSKNSPVKTKLLITWTVSTNVPPLIISDEKAKRLQLSSRIFDESQNKRPSKLFVQLMQNHQLGRLLSVNISKLWVDAGAGDDGNSGKPGLSDSAYLTDSKSGEFDP